MIKGLTRDGLGNLKNLETHIILAAKNDIDVVDTDGNALRELIEAKGIEGAKQFLQENQVQIGAIQFPVDWRNSDDAFYNDLPDLLEDAKIAKAFGCKIFNTFFMPSTDQDPLQHLMKLTNRIKICAQMIKGYGCNIALEFVGPYHMRKLFKNEFIWDLPTTLEWIDMIGEPNVGVLLDSIHWYTSGGKIEDITAIDPAKIAYVHINDGPELPRKEILDNGRLYPGEGIIDLVGFLKALKDVGYAGVVSQEVLTEKEPVESSEILAERSGQAMAEVFVKAGLQ
ncbi:sugar phosphate isomerase/epimerase family protein [Virgibacillus halophilus]|uniref:Sugar phosphate isomerase/epimerase family protein n=1 Tax=Tigheibacillus halophilus TaxID=361280 RepID=A0ABU5C494_9BACI|nr:sugar phosphate isomerase/epimerase family protein [Virgibacillus halophilus]